MNKPETLDQFRRAVVRLFKRANPGVSVTITWIESARVSRWNDGSSGYRGRFLVTADGYAQRVMSATWCGGLMVR